MSILSPGATPSRFLASAILRVTVLPSAVFTVIDGAALSTETTVTVILRCRAAVPPGFSPPPAVAADLSDDAGGAGDVSPGFLMGEDDGLVVAQGDLVADLHLVEPLHRGTDRHHFRIAAVELDRERPLLGGNRFDRPLRGDDVLHLRDTSPDADLVTGDGA